MNDEILTVIHEITLSLKSLAVTLSIRILVAIPVTYISMLCLGAIDEWTLQIGVGAGILSLLCNDFYVCFYDDDEPKTVEE